MLVTAYVLLHYLFVSQTAHLLALFGVFLDVGVKVGVPALPLAFLLLLATNFFSAITPQGSSANLLFAASGYLTQGELYRLGAIATAFNLIVFVAIGLPWLALVALMRRPPPAFRGISEQAESELEGAFGCRVRLGRKSRNQRVPGIGGRPIRAHGLLLASLGLPVRRSSEP